MAAQPQMASRHHTQTEQAQAVCRIISNTIVAVASELDDQNPVKRLLLANAEEYRLAGEGAPRCLQGTPAPASLRLVPNS